MQYKGIFGQYYTYYMYIATKLKEKFDASIIVGLSPCSLFGVCGYRKLKKYILGFFFNIGRKVI